jgi:hypothetical protein
MKKSLILLLALLFSSVVINAQDVAKSKKNDTKVDKNHYKKEWKKNKKQELEKSINDTNEGENGDRSNIKVIEEGQDWIKDGEEVQSDKRKEENERGRERGENGKKREKKEFKKRGKGRRNSSENQVAKHPETEPVFVQ